MSVFHLRRINLPIWDQVQNGLTCRYDIIFSIVCFIRLMIRWTFRYSTTNPYSTFFIIQVLPPKKELVGVWNNETKIPENGETLSSRGGGQVMRLASDRPDVNRYVSDGGSPTMLSCGSRRTLPSSRAARRGVAQSSQPSSHRCSTRHVWSCLSWQPDMPPSAVNDVTGPSSLLRLNNQLFIPSQFPRSSHAEVQLPASRQDKNVNRRFQLDFGCQFKKIYRSMVLNLYRHDKPATF